MRFMLMICLDQEQGQKVPPEEMANTLAEYQRFGEEMRRRSVIQGGERLRWSSEAVTVSVQDGKVLTHDGPFAETKEQIGGFYIVDCRDRDEAIEIASKIPGARVGKIEVRPVWEMGE